MLYKTLSAAVYGIDANIIEVEVDISGIKTNEDHFHTVGLPDAAVRESRDRVRAALKNCGYDIPLTHITINLAPADIRKEGSGFDLPMPLGILGAYGGLSKKEVPNCLFVGELSLDGGVRAVRGALPIAIEARARKIAALVVPELNAREAAMVSGVDVYPVRSLLDVIRFVNTGNGILPMKVDSDSLLDEAQYYAVDFKDVRGQQTAKRALEVACAGGHNILMIGPPGSAHNGVLFLDELPEFPRNVLEVMRQPLEDGTVCIARAAMSLTFPARFMLAAAMNPCPCGYFNDRTRECHCTPAMIQRYMSKISGPLLDRIDIHIDVPAVNYKEMRSSSEPENSASIRQRVILAREIQLKRFSSAQRANIYSNAQMAPRHIRQFCELLPDCERLLERAMTQQGLTARAHDRILKVARTVADLEASDQIAPKHVAEAIQYRTLDRTFWA
ncbi:MAG: magnesium chelatase [Acidobacteria bacterium]|nr:MAG: magnesium chelatase [Acidobacteriota bacterium]